MVMDLSERYSKVCADNKENEKLADINRSILIKGIDITDTFGMDTTEIAEKKYDEIKSQIGPVVNIPDVNKIAENYMAACQYGFSNLAKEMHPYINNALFGPLPDNYKQIILDAKNQGDNMLKTQDEMFYQKNLESRGILPENDDDFVK
jgi:hypothetical protein